MSFWKKSLKIDKMHIPRLIGGPMDGFTDSPFRKLVREFSPHELLYTELAHAANIVFASDSTNILRFCRMERPLNFQITTNKIEHIDLACVYILLAGVDMVDLNIGCPARNVVGSGSGSALMADIPRLKAILKRLRVNLPIPFTIKMRAGFKEYNALEIAHLSQDEGADALIIHPRLQNQKFSGKPDYSLVAQIKRQISIPIIISGDIIDADSARAIHNHTGADGFMISRALRGAPWKLKELSEKLQGHDYNISPDLIHKVSLRHLNGMLDYYGPAGLYMFRKHLSFYIKEKPDAALFRSRLMLEESVDAVKEGLSNFFRTQGD